MQQLSWQRIRRARWKRVVMLFGVLLFLLRAEYVGHFLHPFEKNYYQNYQYPLDNVEQYVRQLMSGSEPDVHPINNYDYRFTIANSEKCLKGVELGHVDLLLIVRSAINHFGQRSAIRNTWGKEDRFRNVVIKIVFNLGSLPNNDFVQQAVVEEQRNFGDIIQGDFVDNYYNSTLQTMMGIRWVIRYCSSVDYVLFIDDDMYVSMQNLLLFVQNPMGYPDSLRQQDILQKLVDRSLGRLNLKYGHQLDFFAGFKSLVAPVRDKFSKWYISLTEYPYHLYPPFINGGAMVMTANTLRKLYYFSLYTKHFRFDDVFLGIVARKAGVTPLNNEHFYNDKKPYDPHDYKLVIVSHGYENAQELVSVWTQQRELGYA